MTLPFLGSLFVHFKDEDGNLLYPLLRKLGDIHDAVLTVAPATAKAIEGKVAPHHTISFPMWSVAEG